MSDDPSIEILKALAHPIRLKLLQVLADEELNVGEIEVASKVGQPALSQQLAVLRNAGIVQTRKDAKLVFYRIDKESLSGVAALIEGLASKRSMSPKSSRTSARGVANFARMS
ncbi:ArsR/SmtB family transcription factor [Pontixanthobacter aquaemixtae]|uniref:Metalloregulator ArsR/SmtB family transcription factor n=1 Tax=Pontixanthobacter aquaemixtae TaxID=1958940 RepID=A0A844ZNY5_9SPHN|nr:metalloregulator ArsR/SmtB family transcription factor [Pontixanthobacter aquaemixtae]MXO89264.1 metalloregulator ArsR/SmtB family transcription factor [Pontixanthobacter aquaemixtae]